MNFFKRLTALIYIYIYIYTVYISAVNRLKKFIYIYIYIYTYIHTYKCHSSRGYSGLKLSFFVVNVLSVINGARCAVRLAICII